jgi:hypothetical protein
LRPLRQGKRAAIRTRTPRCWRALSTSGRRRTAARVLATETAARGLTTEALPGLVDHYWQLFDTWLREALAEVQAEQQRGRDGE